ncbi:hypothetical protein CCACVL1_15853 [Corchorus capsularis]|uniref:Uncharacterized protein n=1 Tax=Corchorus capsularis TaxID=210143 RepID=A0A1R3I0X7_COCAP|nr:hypothetical protein CCACVL1_15853 [Corchorus capsularis]
MDASSSKEVMESLDSLWFFSNVLSFTKLEPKGDLATTAIDEEDNIVKEEEEEEEESKEKTQSNSQNLQNEAPASSENWVSIRCPKCGEMGVEFEQQIMKPVKEVEFAEAEPKEKQPEIRRRRRSKRRKRSKRKVLGELDFGFHGGNLDSESWFSEESNIKGYGNFETQHYTKMPPLNDGLAMKQHLKSWAHAVACTVR